MGTKSCAMNFFKILSAAVICLALVSPAAGQTRAAAEAEEALALMAQLDNALALVFFNAELGFFADAKGELDAAGFPFWGGCQACLENRAISVAETAAAVTAITGASQSAGDIAFSAGETSLLAGDAAKNSGNPILAAAFYLAAEGSFTLSKDQRNLSAGKYDTGAGHWETGTEALLCIMECLDCNCPTCEQSPCACCDFCMEYPCVCDFCPICLEDPCICSCPFCGEEPCICEE